MRQNADKDRAAGIIFKTLLTEQSRWLGRWRHPHPAAGSYLLYIMITIFLCRLTDGEWRRIERHHTTRGFASMLEAPEFAEALNAKTWERFDWIREPQKAYLAFRD